MITKKDLTHREFGRLTVTEFVGVIKGKKFWKCLCVCGNTKEVYYHNLIIGKTKSCGCITKELSAEWGRNRQTHKMIKTPEYKSWACMKSRCSNNRDKEKYASYGGRGIRVCRRWVNSFENFYEDMGPIPTKGYTLDRIDVNGNYCKGNCRWASPEEQTRNRRNTILVSVKGRTMVLAEWCSILSLRKYYLNDIHSRFGLDKVCSKIEELLEKQKEG